MKTRKPRKIAKNGTRHTSRTMSMGAAIGPIRPTIEQVVIRVLRIGVGHSSAENTQRTADTDAMAIMLRAKHSRINVVQCGGTKHEAISAVEAVSDVAMMAVLRPTHFRMKNDAKAAGTSAETVVR